jgi:arsenate reductase
MAEGFLRAAGGDRFEPHSAGTKPSVVNPMAIAVMSEAGIDISGQRSKSVEGYVGTHFQYVITVCDNAKEQCPIFPGPSMREHWPFDDPADAAGSREEKLAVFRRVRDEIRERVRSFVSEREGGSG